MKKTKEHYRGCLLGGAIGDALGWPVEFEKYGNIVAKYGPHGITDLPYPQKGKAQITDDTQMTLFTAEGLLRAQARLVNRGICNPVTVVYNAYQRWMYTQGYHKIKRQESIYNAWLLGIKELYARRAPGNSCLTSLESLRIGSLEYPINNSKGCGGVMRVAPIGLLVNKENVFDLACECAALTHGHPNGYLPAGALSYVISELIGGADIENAINNALEELKKRDKSEETIQALEKAIRLSKLDVPAREAIKMLGEGWVGEEALAIAIYCVLKYKDDFAQALITAVNHDGDSDSTGSITGNILGTYLGIDAIPEKWQKNIELSTVITQISDDLLVGYMDTNEWQMKYPGD